MCSFSALYKLLLVYDGCEAFCNVKCVWGGGRVNTAAVNAGNVVHMCKIKLNFSVIMKYINLEKNSVADP